MSDEKQSPRPFRYQWEKMSQARSALVAPHLEGEDRDFAHSFHACGKAFRELDMAGIEDEDVLRWVEIIRTTIDTSGVSDPDGKGTTFHRARQLSIDQKREFASAVDQLAHWFASERHDYPDSGLL